ncbi:MAG: T9SS type A sorting domain-containing protein [Bacteroidetes bacterium]|nr:MAG: T9SS type A sorting domain-containing protein [Bacteroidota bacterium]
MRRTLPLILLLAVMTAASSAQTAVVAGFRASRILNSYPNRQFPPPAYWSGTAKSIAAKFPGSVPGGVWIVSLYISNGTTQFNFPSNGTSLPYVNFISTDQNEAYLKHFDTTGVRVWLQVEPGEANVDTLISVVLSRYKHHPCVIGFGVDVEWYRGNAKLSDSAAQRWDQTVRSIDTAYTLFVKHYGQSWMPPSYRGKVLFVDDSQDFTFSGNPFGAMKSEFASWGAKFSPNGSAFQFGYPADSVWWKAYADPVKTIGDGLLASVPTVRGLFWVDFTIAKLFPVTSLRPEAPFPSSIALRQNYPNPFNPVTTIPFTLRARGWASVTVYDLLGRPVARPAEGVMEAGDHAVPFDGAALGSGTYLYRLTAGAESVTRTMLLMK